MNFLEKKFRVIAEEILLTQWVNFEVIPPSNFSETSILLTGPEREKNYV